MTKAEKQLAEIALRVESAMPWYLDKEVARGLIAEVKLLRDAVGLGYLGQRYMDIDGYPVVIHPLFRDDRRLGEP